MIREPHMWTFWAATIGFFCTSIVRLLTACTARITANETSPHDQRWSAEDAVAAPWGERRDGVACLEGVCKLGEREH